MYFFLSKYFLKESKSQRNISDLAKIEEVVDHPIELFRIWQDEARKYNSKALDICCLATTSKLVLTIDCCLEYLLCTFF